ncbi:MAG: DUF2635 domain-containing protein [Candidatus Pacebacteria bacterium]|nr:DUF2635 domain-containing protein [Candidatus Paceibacterota bacterium]
MLKAIKISEGVRVRHENGELAKDGDLVEENSYWLRRFADGDVALRDPEPEAVIKTAKPAAAASTEKKE